MQQSLNGATDAKPICETTYVAVLEGTTVQLRKRHCNDFALKLKRQPAQVRTTHLPAWHSRIMCKGAAHHEDECVKHIIRCVGLWLSADPCGLERGMKDDGADAERNAYVRLRGQDDGIEGLKATLWESDILLFEKQRHIGIERFAINVIHLGVAHELYGELEMPESVSDVFERETDVVHGT